MQSRDLEEEKNSAHVVAASLDKIFLLLNEVYNKEYKGKGKHTSEMPNDVNDLLEACVAKYDKWKNKSTGIFGGTREDNSLDDYIKDLNTNLNTHHHARMLLQVLATISQLATQNTIFPTYHDTKKINFLNSMRSIPEITPSHPKKSVEEYNSLMDMLKDIKEFDSKNILYKIQVASETNQPITDATAKEFYLMTKGTGENAGKILANQFMESLVPAMSPAKLAELTRGVMRAQVQDQMVSATEPFLRKTGVITDRLYLECAQRFNYNPVSPNPPSEMVMLNKEILTGKGFVPGKDNTESVNNAVVEIDFKIGTITPDPKKIEKEVVQFAEQSKVKKSPPPIPTNYKHP